MFAKNVALHLAFFVDGIYEVDGRSDKVRAALENKCGWIELVTSLHIYAEYMENILVFIDTDDYPGVIDYEVSCAFGGWYANFVVANRDEPTEVQAKTQIGILIVDFFGNLDSAEKAKAIIAALG